MIVPGADGQRTADLGRPEAVTLSPSGLDPAILFGAPAARPGPGSSGEAIVPKPSTSVAPSPVDRLGSSGDGLAVWPTGSYAIAFRFPSDGPTIVRWLRIDLVAGAGGPG